MGEAPHSFFVESKPENRRNYALVVSISKPAASIQRLTSV